MAESMAERILDTSLCQLINILVPPEKHRNFCEKRIECLEELRDGRKLAKALKLQPHSRRPQDAIHMIGPCLNGALGSKRFESLAAQLIQCSSEDLENIVILVVSVCEKLGWRKSITARVESLLINIRKHYYKAFYYCCHLIGIKNMTTKEDLARKFFKSFKPLFNESAGSSFMPNINYTSNYDESYEYSNKSQSQLLITSCSQSSSSSTSFSCWSNASLDTGTSDWTLDSSINSSLNYSHLRKSVVRNKEKDFGEKSLDSIEEKDAEETVLSQSSSCITPPPSPELQSQQSHKKSLSQSDSQRKLNSNELKKILIKKRSKKENELKSKRSDVRKKDYKLLYRHYKQLSKIQKKYIRELLKKNNSLEKKIDISNQQLKKYENETFLLRFNKTKLGEKPSMTENEKLIENELIERKNSENQVKMKALQNESLSFMHENEVITSSSQQDNDSLTCTHLQETVPRNGFDETLDLIQELICESNGSLPELYLNSDHF